MSEDEDSFKVSDSAQRQRLMAAEIRGLKDLTQSVNSLTSAFRQRFAGAGITATSATQHTQLSQGIHHELKSQSELLRKILEKANRTGGSAGSPLGISQDWESRMPLKGLAGMGERIAKILGRFGDFFKPIIDNVKNIGGKIWGGLKKSGLLPGIFMGVGIAVGAVMAKILQASPLLQAMMKILSMGITLMLRPIGDFIGSIMRPMMIYFIKDVAVPFFQSTKGLVRDGGKIGKGLLAFFIQPIESIGAGIVLALSKFPFFEGATGSAVKSAELMFTDPARAFRKNKGIGEFEFGGGMFPSTQEWQNMLQGTKVKGLGADNDVFKGTGSDIDWLMKEMSDPESRTMADHYTTSRWKQLAKDRERLYLTTGTTSGLPDPEMMPGTDTPKTEAPSSLITPLIPYADLEKFFDWLRGGWDQFWEGIMNPLPDAAGDTGDAFEDLAETLGQWGESWDDFVASINAGANDWGRQISRWADDQATAWGGFTKQIEKDTASWLEWAGAGIEQGWEWITNFGKVNDAFAETETESEKANKSWIDSIWDWIESIKIGIFGTRVAVDGFADTIVTAGDKITTAADVATGGIFQGSGHGRGTSAGTGENPWNPIDAVIGAVTGQPSNVFKGVFGEPTTSGGLYGTPKADDVGHSNKLGAFSDARFESSPGKFVDIYSKGEKVDPSSAEGKTIQGIYQRQYDTKIANQKQQETMAKVKSAVTTADAGKAYILAGGGEKGLAAVEMAKAEGLSMVHYADIVKLADALGLKDHPMIKTAREGLAAKIAMAKKIMAQRVAAGQTPSIQGDMLDLFPDAEDSDFGWSDASLAEQESQYQATYGSIGMIPAGMSLEGYQASLGIPGKYAQALGGFTATNTTAARVAGGGFKGGGRGAGGAGGRSRGGGSTGGGTKSGSKGSGSKGSAGSGRKGGGGGTSSGGGGGTSSGSKGSGKKGSAGKGRRGQFGGIIDEPILGIGLRSGQEWLLGEAGREMVIPEGQYMGDGINVLNINIGNITREADYIKLKPLIQRWILEASSRRGTV